MIEVIGRAGNLLGVKSTRCGTGRKSQRQRGTEAVQKKRIICKNKIQTQVGQTGGEVADKDCEHIPWPDLAAAQT